MKLSPECATKISSYVGFALKAGKVVFGADNIIASNKRMLVLISESLGANSASKVLAHAKETGMRVVTVEDVGAIVSREGVKAIGIREKNLAEAILKQIDAE